MTRVTYKNNANWPRVPDSCSAQDPYVQGNVKTVKFQPAPPHTSREPTSSSRRGGGMRLSSIRLGDAEGLAALAKKKNRVPVLFNASVVEHLPGYAGHVPRFQHILGKTFGAATREIIQPPVDTLRWTRNPSDPRGSPMALAHSQAALALPFTTNSATTRSTAGIASSRGSARRPAYWDPSAELRRTMATTAQPSTSSISSQNSAPSAAVAAAAGDVFVTSSSLPVSSGTFLPRLSSTTSSLPPPASFAISSRTMPLAHTHVQSAAAPRQQHSRDF